MITEFAEAEKERMAKEAAYAEAEKEHEQVGIRRGERWGGEGEERMLEERR
jgi:hypothetical protein